MGRPKKLRWKEYDFGVKNPGLFSVSDELLRRMRPDCYGFRARLSQWRHDRAGTLSARDEIKEQLWLGSIQAAVVLSTNPGRVAAYSEMLDCVAILAYNPGFMMDLGLNPGGLLLTVNYYHTGRKDADLVFGPGKCSNWTGLHPIIADFVTDDLERLAERKQALDEQYWKRTWELGSESIKLRPKVWRSGTPGAVVATE